MSRGVLYLVWDDASKYGAVLERSKASVAKVHPELAIEVIHLDADGSRGLLEKAKMFDLSPFDETLFLDADTVVLDRLDMGFEKAALAGVACCINECPWANRHVAIKRETIEYNTGVIFFTRAAKPLFDRWRDLSTHTDTSMIHVANGAIARMPYSDQCTFAMAAEQLSFSPFVLPMNFNFRPSWHKSFFGKIKIYHSYVDVPPPLGQMVSYYNSPGAVIQYHEVARNVS